MSKRVGCWLVSVLLGFGLATMFHRVCVGRDCVIVKGPSVDYVTKHMWRNGQECYKYKVASVKCPDEVEVESSAPASTDDVV